MKNTIEEYSKIIQKADKVILITTNKKGTSIATDNVSIQDALDMLTDTQDIIFNTIQENE